MMQTTILLVTGPCLIAFLGSLSLYVAGTSLKSGSHTLVWALAVVCGAAQWGLLISPLHSLIPYITGCVSNLLGLIGPILYLHGFRLRRGGERRDGVFLFVAVAICVGIAALCFALPGKAAVGAILGAVKFCYIAWTIGVLLRASRPLSPSERALAIVLACVILAGIAIVIVAFTAFGPAGAGWKERFLLRVMLAEPASAGIVLFTLLLIASDYSRERRRLVFTDPLTGILNRLGFDAVVRMADRRSRRVLSLAMADIDHFKAINDHHGHAAGDEVLAQLADRIVCFLKPGETAARIGGEEFAMMLNDGAEAAFQRIEAIREALSYLHLADYPEVRITASFGVAERTRGEAFPDLIARADTALYRAKREGRNRSLLAERVPG